eukprot:UN05502
MAKIPVQSQNLPNPIIKKTRVEQQKDDTGNSYPYPLTYTAPKYKDDKFYIDFENQETFSTHVSDIVGMGLDVETSVKDGHCRVTAVYSWCPFSQFLTKGDIIATLNGKINPTEKDFINLTGYVTISKIVPPNKNYLDR